MIFIMEQVLLPTKVGNVVPSRVALLHGYYTDIQAHPIVMLLPVLHLA
jgi:hypothetical protein